MRLLITLALVAAAIVGTAAPAHAADYPTRVDFAAWVAGAHWMIGDAWAVQAVVHDTVVGQTLAGNSSCTTGAGTVHFSYTTSRGASGALPDSCLDLHGVGYATLPTTVTRTLLPGDTVTFSASFTATEAADYASSTTPGTATVTAVPLEGYIDIFTTGDSPTTATGARLTTVLSPFDYVDIGTPPGTWTLWISTGGTITTSRTHDGGSTVEWELDGLEPSTDYTVVASFAPAASDLGRTVVPDSYALELRTLAAPAASASPAASPSAEPSAQATELDAEKTTGISPVLPIGIASVLLLAGSATAIALLLRRRRTLG